LGSYSAFRSRFFFLLQKKKQEKKSSTQVGLRASVHNLEIWKTTKKQLKSKGLKRFILEPFFIDPFFEFK
jgi:hypothetical protein